MGISILWWQWTPLFLGLIGVKIIGEYLLMWPGTALFDSKELRFFLIPSSLLQLPMVIFAVIFGVFGKFGWKGQWGADHDECD